MTNWAVIAAQVAGGRTIWWLVGCPGGFTEAMFRMHVLWLLVFLPRQISNNGMRGNDQRGHTRVMLQHELSLFPLFSLQPFFPSDESKTAPTQCCSLRLTTGPVAGVNWANCVVWGWATAMPVQLFPSWGNRVARRFRRDFTGSRALETTRWM